MPLLQIPPYPYIYLFIFLFLLFESISKRIRNKYYKVI
uniref:Uncharacterized protein n=1 Tax=uncultured bacterium contig00013 TaxID=1181504 RepID=A0A806KJW1_9BACT|nr:hypothetical protein [uncultured bacterium contig00013]